MEGRVQVTCLLWQPVGQVLHLQTTCQLAVPPQMAVQFEAAAVTGYSGCAHFPSAAAGGGG